jgi:hypothetical protein
MKHNAPHSGTQEARAGASAGPQLAAQKTRRGSSLEREPKKPARAKAIAIAVPRAQSQSIMLAHLLILEMQDMWHIVRLHYHLPI